MTVSLASVVLIITMSVAVGYTVRNIDTLVSFPAFFKENIVEEQIKSTILPKIKANTSVKSIEYFDKEKAKANLDSGLAGLASGTLKQDENYAWRYIMITPNRSEDYSNLVNFVKNGEFKDIFDEVSSDNSSVDNILKFYNWVNIIGIVTVIIFSVVAVLVMSNILRMTIYNHKEEIEIMRLVGATNNYIRGPFVTQGILYNLISALLVVVVFVSVISILAPTIQIYLGTNNLTSGGDLISQIYFSLFLTIFVSVGVGVLTVYVSIQRYLKS
jgi:cell division transport system permease protein